MTDIDKLQRKINEINEKCGSNKPGFINDLPTFSEDMESKDIDRTARDHALKRYPEECGDDAYEAGLQTGYRNGYVDSHNSRQSEINELIEALGEMYKACSNIEAMNAHGNGKAALIRNYVQLWWPKATQLLKRYENEKDNKD